MLHNLIVLLFSVDYKAKNDYFESVEYTHFLPNFWDASEFYIIDIA